MKRFTRQAYITYKKVSKANKIRKLLRYSIACQYDLISSSTSDANRKNSCIRRLQHLTHVLRRQRYMHINGFHTKRLILFKICMNVHNNVRYWIRY